MVTTRVATQPVYLLQSELGSTFYKPAELLVEEFRILRNPENSSPPAG